MPETAADAHGHTAVASSTTRGEANAAIAIVQARGRRGEAAEAAAETEAAVVVEAEVGEAAAAAAAEVEAEAGAVAAAAVAVRQAASVSPRTWARLLPMCRATTRCSSGGKRTLHCETADRLMGKTAPNRASSRRPSTSDSVLQHSSAMAAVAVAVAVAVATEVDGSAAWPEVRLLLLRGHTTRRAGRGKLTLQEQPSRWPPRCSCLGAVR